MEPDWQRLIKEQEQSGMTMEIFCRTRGINKNKFKRHKYCDKEPQKAMTGAGFIEITAVPKALITIRLKSGHSLEVATGFNESDVRRLIAVLESC